MSTTSEWNTLSLILNYVFYGTLFVHQMENHSLQFIYIYLSYLKSIILKRKRNIQDKSRKNPLHLSSCIINLKIFFIYFTNWGERDVILLFMTKIFPCTVCINDVKMLCKILENRWERKIIVCHTFIVNCFKKDGYMPPQFFLNINS